MSGVVLLSGGVGGSKLALGLYRHLPAGELTVIVNTADDFEHLGMAISPDVDTVTYTLAGLVEPTTGWGRQDERWECMKALEALGGETWFRLGDRDLALHAMRTGLLSTGNTLTAVTRRIADALGLCARILPMTDDRVRTQVDTEEGVLGFQEYFVRERCRPVVKEISFRGAAQAAATPEVMAALTDQSLTAIILAPSNPFLSLDPILSVPGIRSVLQETRVPVIGISPLIGDNAFKGPTAKIMRELGSTVSSDGIATRYRDLLDGFIIDLQDEAALPHIERLGLAVGQTSITMSNVRSKIALAKRALALADRCRTGWTQC